MAERGRIAANCGRVPRNAAVTEAAANQRKRPCSGGYPESARSRVTRERAQGHSNPEIAQALFLTRRTVETHLTHAYQKLDITSRAELADALQDAPDHD